MGDKCAHMNFAAHVNVARLEDIGRFNAEIKIQCAECGMPFRFVGLPIGLNLEGACIAPDGLEARLAILPQDRVPSPLGRFTGFQLGVRSNG